MRHRLPFIALLVLLLPLIGFAPPPAGAQEGDVPMFRGNVARTGEMPGPGPKGDPVENWRFATGGEETSSPAVVGGAVYVGSHDQHLYAIDAATGQERWVAWLRNSVISSPAVADGMVYAGSTDRRVYALDAATGQERWTFGTGDEAASLPAATTEG